MCKALVEVPGTESHRLSIIQVKILPVLTMHDCADEFSLWTDSVESKWETLTASLSCIQQVKMTS